MHPVRDVVVAAAGHELVRGRQVLHLERLDDALFSRQRNLALDQAAFRHIVQAAFRIGVGAVEFGIAEGCQGRVVVRAFELVEGRLVVARVHEVAQRTVVGAVIQAVPGVVGRAIGQRLGCGRLAEDLGGRRHGLAYPGLRRIRLGAAQRSAAGGEHANRGGARELQAFLCLIQRISDHDEDS